MGGLLEGVAGWFGDVIDEMGRISLPVLIAALALQTGQTALNALSWRNILRAAYPAGGVTYPSVLGIYAAGVGLNNVLPAQAGTAAMISLFRAVISRSTVPGIVGAAFVQGIFFMATAAAVYILLFATSPAAAQVNFGALADHPLIVLVAAVAAVALLAWPVRLLVRRFERAVADAREGAAILGSPRRYAAGVLAPQALGYAMRVTLTGLLMWGYGLRVTPHTVFLVIAVSSLSSLVAVTPGGIGTQQALASVALRDVASSSAVTAYSLGQHALVTAWNIVLGVVLLGATVGLGASRRIVRARRGREPTAPPGRPGGSPDDGP